MGRLLTTREMLTLRQLSAGRALVSKGSTLVAWRTALIKAGVIFLDADEHVEEGVRFRKRP
jgi:hypothetical protein